MEEATAYSTAINRCNRITIQKSALIFVISEYSPELNPSNLGFDLLTSWCRVLLDNLTGL